MRVSNNATAHDVVKNFHSFTTLKNGTEFIDRNVELLVHLVAVTRRPTQTLIKDAVLLQYTSTLDGTASAFSNMVAKSISHVRVLSKSTTSGKKTHESVKRVAAIMNKQIGKTVMQHLRACAQIVRLCCAFIEGLVRRQAWRLSRLLTRTPCNTKLWTALCECLTLAKSSRRRCAEGPQVSCSRALLPKSRSRRKSPT